ncbi:MAG: FCD domain-containing protein, partial [Pseudomonadota bacterium]
ELEAMAGRKACENANDEDIAEICAIHDAMIAHYKAGERLEYYKLNQQIHSSIVAASASGALAEMHSLLQSRMKRIRFVGHNAPENWRGAVQEHEEMIAALKKRDGERLSEVLKRHIAKTWERVSTSL